MKLWCVRVVTPSLNKSFKFQSDWPYNNSQAYLLKNIIKDIEGDNEVKEIKNEDNYTITSKVNFPNNPKLVKQRVTIDKDLSVKKVEILDKDGISLMTFTVNNINYKPMFDESFFQINSIINSESNKETDKSEKTSTIDDIIYPLSLSTTSASVSFSISLTIFFNKYACELLYGQSL